MASSLIRGIDSPDMRSAGPDLLSVALMDARNHSLHLASQLVAADALAREGSPAADARCHSLAWELGHIGWFQERWIARNMQRAMGLRCDPRASRLPSLEPQADPWWDDGQTTAAQRRSMVLPKASDATSSAVAKPSAATSGKSPHSRYSCGRS